MNTNKLDIVKPLKSDVEIYILPKKPKVNKINAWLIAISNKLNLSCWVNYK